MLSTLLAVLLAQVPSAMSSPVPAPRCIRHMQGAVIGATSSDSSKGPPPYYAVVEMHVNADDSVKWVRIYKSSGSAEYDKDALQTARALLTIPEIADCEHVESDFFYIHYPSGYAAPQFTPNPRAGAGTSTPAAAPKPLVIDEFGAYPDKAVWLYRTAAGKNGFGEDISGTNETLVMPSPRPEPGGAVEAVEIGRHPFDTLGYPLHIALVEKLFAASYQVAIYATALNHELWVYQYNDPVADEKHVTTANRAAFKAWGPYHADAVPLTQAPEPEIQAAFDYAKGAMTSIVNLPESQKNLANYGVLFIDDGDTVWVEFGPRFGPGEAPHLGCQTQLGRDMVFGWNKKQSGKGQSGKFLQCF